MLSAKPSLQHVVKKGLISCSTFEELAVDQEHVGYIRSVTPYGCFVGLVHGLVGLVNLKDLAPRFINDPQLYFKEGQSVIAKVKAIDAKTGKAQFTFKDVDDQEEVFSTLRLRSYFGEVEKAAAAARETGAGDRPKLAIGQRTTVEVESIRDVGIIVSVADGFKGFITKEHAREHTCEVGDTLKARILDIDWEKGICDLSLLAKLVKSAGKEKAPTAGELRATIELVKEDYVVLSAAGGHLMFALTKKMNDQRSPFGPFKVGNSGNAKVIKSKTLTCTICSLKLDPRKTKLKAKDAVATKETAEEQAASIEEVKPGMLLTGKVRANSSYYPLAPPAPPYYPYPRVKTLTTSRGNIRSFTVG